MSYIGMSTDIQNENSEYEKIDPRRMLLAELLKEFVDKAGGTKRVAEAAGIKPSTLYGWQTGKFDPPVLALNDIARACGFPLNAIISREPQRIDILGRHVRGALALGDAPAPGVVRVPVLDIAAAAGAGQANGDPEVTGHLPFAESFLRRAGVAAAQAHVLTARGQSMEPTIRNGALVLVDRAFQRPRHDNIYVLVDDGDVRLKRFIRRVDGVFLVSDNPDKARYPDEWLGEEQMDRIQVEGRVCWTEATL